MNEVKMSASTQIKCPFCALIFPFSSLFAFSCGFLFCEKWMDIAVRPLSFCSETTVFVQLLAHALFHSLDWIMVRTLAFIFYLSFCVDRIANKFHFAHRFSSFFCFHFGQAKYREFIEHLFRSRFYLNFSIYAVVTLCGSLLSQNTFLILISCIIPV